MRRRSDHGGAADGSDIRFADADGNLIPHEIDTWNALGESLVWVQVPTLSGTATTFTMYYGTADVSGLPAVTESDVWTGANFNAVWHFSGSNKESANGLTPSDSSSTAPSYTATTFGVGPGSGKVYLTAVYKADKTVELYVNGVLAKSAPLNQLVTPTEKLYIGSCNKIVWGTHWR